MATIQGKKTPERTFANFAKGVLEGYVQGRGMAREDRQESRSLEVQQAELKNQQLNQQLEQAKLNEFNAQAQLRQSLLEAQVKTAQTKDPLALQQSKADFARYQAEAAKWHAESQRLEYESKKQIHDLTELLNSLRQQGAQGAVPGPQSSTGGSTSFLPSMTGESSYDTTDESADTTSIPSDSTDYYNNLPAVEPGAQLAPMPGSTGATQATVPGGRQVLTGPPRLGNQMEAEQTNPFIRPGDMARTILPPLEQPGATARTTPILDAEVTKALQSKNVNDSLKNLLSTQGVAFGATMQKLKDENPGRYADQVGKLVDENEKQHPDVYRAFRTPGSSSSALREKVMQILTDPNERAAVNPMRDVDAAVSESVAELSVDNLFKLNPSNGIRSYLAVDAANNGDIARYHGRRLNESLDEVFGTNSQYVRFNDDQDYTLRQIIQALYTDDMSASGNALLGYTEPILASYRRPKDHKATALLDAYWRPVRELVGQGKERERMSHIPRFGNRHF